MDNNNITCVGKRKRYFWPVSQ